MTPLFRIFQVEGRAIEEFPVVDNHLNPLYRHEVSAFSVYIFFFQGISKYYADMANYFSSSPSDPSGL